MIDSFPFDSWEEVTDAFWTFGPGGSTGTWVLTVLGIIVMIAAWVGWFVVEHKKLMAQADHLRGAGALPTVSAQPISRTDVPGYGSTEPPG